MAAFEGEGQKRKHTSEATAALDSQQRPTTLKIYLYDTLYFFFFETGANYIILAVLELTIH